MRFSTTELTIVKSSSALRELAASELQRYVDDAPQAQLSLPADVCFAKEGERDPGLYFVVHGIIELYSTGTNNKEKTLDFLRDDALLGCEALFNDLPLPYSARTLTDATLLHVPSAIAAEWMDRHPRFSRSILSLVVRRIDFFDKDVHTFRTKKATARIVCYLLCHFNRAPRTADGTYSLDVPIPRAKLASRLGITGPHLSRAFRELQDAGLLVARGRGYFIPDVPALSRYVCPAGCDFGDD